MSYAGYVIAAYSVFALVLAWEFAATRFRIARLLRAARHRQDRSAGRRRPNESTPTP